MQWINAYAKKTYQNMGQYIRWVVFGIITGIAVGLFSTVFAICLNYASDYRESHPYVFLTLPLGGMMIVFLYKVCKYENNAGTDSVIHSIHSEIMVPLRMTILIFFSTIITIFCGGSVGREGAALQIGSGIGNKLGDLFRFDDKDKKIIIMSGMAAAFGALFQTPMAAAIFAMEVSSVGIMYYAALVPCACAALIGYGIVNAFGIKGEDFQIINTVDFSVRSAAGIVLLAVCCALISILFCVILQSGSRLFKKWFKNQYIRIAVGGLALIILTLLLGTQDYLGVGMGKIERAIHGEAVPWAFICKMIFTAVTISAGFKGGEIVPSFFIGATFGCVAGPLLGLPASLCAGVGMIAVFCGVTNCPITSMLIAFELFGFEEAYHFLIAIATSYMLSGYYSLYHAQTIVYSKFENKFVNKKTNEEV